MTGVEVIADLRSASPEVAAGIVRQWATEDRASDLVRSATFVIPALARKACTELPSGWRVVTDRTSPGFWTAVMAAAGRAGRPAVALTAPVAPGVEAIGVMLDLLDSDAMYGAAAARVQCWTGCCLQTVSRLGGRTPDWIPLAAMADLPAHELVGEILTPCVILQPLLLTDFGDAEPPFDSLAGTVTHRLIAARVRIPDGARQSGGRASGRPGLCRIGGAGGFASSGGCRLQVFEAEIERGVDRGPRRRNGCSSS
jgi:hypothetical protein